MVPVIFWLIKNNVHIETKVVLEVSGQKFYIFHWKLHICYRTFHIKSSPPRATGSWEHPHTPSRKSVDRSGHMCLLCPLVIGFGDLQLQLETDDKEVRQDESWAVSDDGSLRHCATGILCGFWSITSSQKPDSQTPAAGQELVLARKKELYNHFLCKDISRDIAAQSSKMT